MTSWLDSLSEARQVRAIYGDSLPDLSDVNIHEIDLHRDGPRATLRFDLAKFPETPPEKWQQSGFNTAQVELTFIDITHIDIRSWDTSNAVSMKLETNQGNVTLKTLDSEKPLCIAAKFAYIGSISAYRKH